MKAKIVVGMSGGVDSSVAAALLQKEGYEVIGVHLVIRPHGRGEVKGDACRDPGAAGEAIKSAAAMGVRLHVVDISGLFKKRVIDYFADEYGRGRTPNPCVVCNRTIKFEALIREAGELGADCVATGHYARVSKGGRCRLLRAADTRYDQTYFLAFLTQEQLSRSLFPLCGMEKERAREIAAEMGLSVHDSRSSHDVCFIEGRDYRKFLKERYPGLVRKGDVIDAGGRKLGEHEGIAFYTVGQRHGLGIGGGRPLYVTRIKPSTNTVVLGGEGDLHKNGMIVDECSWIPFDELPPTMECTVKVRYGRSEAHARCTRKRGGRVKVVFDKPQKAIAPGQVAVFYRGEEVLGGGFIERSI